MKWAIPQQLYLNLCAGSLLLIAPLDTLAHGEDDPLLTRLTIEKIETRATDGPDSGVLEGEFWAGYDLHKLKLRADIEGHAGETEAAELQLLYSRAIAPYWNLETGWRHDLRPQPERDWLVVGVEGLTPWSVAINASLFMGEGGQTGARLEAEQEWHLSQRWVLSPELEMNVYGKRDAATGVGSGLADIEMGLRLRYQVTRHFAPYAGVNWNRLFGDSRELARSHGEQSEDSQIVFGFTAWY
ncbi:MAG: copper resistance protein B [Gammaproteobacteria bacterium]